MERSASSCKALGYSPQREFVGVKKAGVMGCWPSSIVKAGKKQSAKGRKQTKKVAGSPDLSFSHLVYRSIVAMRTGAHSSICVQMDRAYCAVTRGVIATNAAITSVRREGKRQFRHPCP
jgi:hypothetical protein